jgi:hypothetical protein
VVSNAGGLDPEGCAEAVAAVADGLGCRPTIAYVSGRRPARAPGRARRRRRRPRPLRDRRARRRHVALPHRQRLPRLLGIVEALAAGADIVVTGRTTDAAIVCGPAAWHHGWGRDSWDELAGGVVAGHVIECGTQATGGNYSFFTEVPGMSRTGFPWAEVAADGSSVIGKHDGTGGEVSVGTVTSQLLYEIGGPSYLGPDVTARFDTISLEQVGRDRVRISGTRGEPPPATLKVAMNELGGYRNEVAVGLTGLDIEAKAALVEEAFWLACPHAPEDYESVTSHLTRTDKVDPPTNEEAVAVWRLTLKDPDERKVGRVVFNANVELALATIPGYFGIGGGGGEAKPYGVFRPAVVPADLVPQHVVVRDGQRTAVDSGAPGGHVEVAPAPGPSASPPGGPTVPAPLGRVVGARSGDKGGNANLGVFARTDEAWAWLDAFLTTERFRQLLPETAALAVDRHRLPAVRSLNFVVHGLLQEGVAASTRQDGQAKGLGEWLRARVVDVPSSLLDAAPATPPATGGTR